MKEEVSSVSKKGQKVDVFAYSAYFHSCWTIRRDLLATDCPLEFRKAFPAHLWNLIAFSSSSSFYPKSMRIVNLGEWILHQMPNSQNASSHWATKQPMNCVLQAEINGEGSLWERNHGCYYVVRAVHSELYGNKVAYKFQGCWPLLHL